MSAAGRPKVLCVDDEPRVADGLGLHLRNDYEVHSACSGEEALQVLKEIGGVAVVVSDMRMPGMDGATLLHHVLTSYPDATRILLTAESGRESAVKAVNKAHIFSFLTKPCPPSQLKAAVDAGVMQHRLIHAERTILKETLIGCIKALIDVLGLANPLAFARATRIKRLAIDLADMLGCTEFWQLEAAALLSQVGYISLSPGLIQKLYCDEPLTPEEKKLAAGIAGVPMMILESVPRLEPVVQILTALAWKDEQIARLGDGTIGLGTRILGVVLEYDVLISQGHSVDVAIQTLRRQAPRFTADLVERFGVLVGAGTAAGEVREIALNQVQPGMIIMQDIRTHLGTLLVPRGFEVSSIFVSRIDNLDADLLKGSIKVVVPAAKAPSR